MQLMSLIDINLILVAHVIVLVVEHDDFVPPRSADTLTNFTLLRTADEQTDFRLYSYD